LDEIQAAFLSIKLKKLDTDNEYRREIAKLYISGIKNHKLKLPDFDKTKNHVFHVFHILCESRDELKEFLLTNEVQTLIHYLTPPHKQKAFKEWNKLSYPITEKIHQTTLSLPIHATIEKHEVNKVIQLLNRF
jgi:dTDP-4-amino-4,6-dideoxygalactose transaminase